MTTNLKVRSNSKMSFEDKNIDKPTWTLFFEGTLYRRYIRYLKHHDLSQVRVTTLMDMYILHLNVLVETCTVTM